MALTTPNMVAHENIVAKAHSIQDGWSHPTGVHPVSEHPLIPAQLVRRPALWLKAVTKCSAVYSGGPDFALAFCVT